MFSYLVSLSAKPLKTQDMHLFYYHFNIDQPESLADNVTARNFADEVGLILDWQVLDSLSCCALLAVVMPGEAARQFTDGGRPDLVSFYAVCVVGFVSFRLGNNWL